MRCLEFYSGVGGWHLALRPEAGGSHKPRAGRRRQCEVAGAFELSPVANAVYAHNFGAQPRQCNIEKLSAADLDKCALPAPTPGPTLPPLRANAAAAAGEAQGGALDTVTALSAVQSARQEKRRR